jgi:hypothetical protein|tara:strand:+ start:1525 stop:1743 length:219 start_codon:yes stop_codon:yes gene_type:complete
MDYTMTNNIKLDYVQKLADKVRKAEKMFDDGGIYICPICDGKSQMCDDDYQSLECETLERDILGDEYYALCR